MKKMTPFNVCVDGTSRTLKAQYYKNGFVNFFMDDSRGATGVMECYEDRPLKKINRIGNIYGFTGGSFAGMVYGTDGLAPTVNTSGGGQREPLILVYEESPDKHGGRMP